MNFPQLKKTFINWYMAIGTLGLIIFAIGYAEAISIGQESFNLYVNNFALHDGITDNPAVYPSLLMIVGSMLTLALLGSGERNTD